MLVRQLSINAIILPKLCSAEELSNMSDVVKKLGRRVYYLLWESGGLEEFVRSQATQRAKEVGFPDYSSFIFNVSYLRSHLFW